MRAHAWAAVVMAACSFDPGGFVASSGDAPTGDAGAVADAPSSDDGPPGSPDATSVGSVDASSACPAPSSGVVGSACSSDDACAGGPGAFCLGRDDGWPTTGYCSHVCASDDDCGPRARCAASSGDGGTRLCVATCCPGGECAASGTTCTNRLGGDEVGFVACLPGDATAADGASCDSFGDCAPGSACSDNPFEAPNGYCITVGCTQGDDSTCAGAGDGTCVDDDPFDGEPPFCVDRCTSTGQCRGGDGYQCVAIGIGTSVCAAPHQDPGSGCVADSQCGAPPWECLTGSDFPGGYCSAAGCTSASNACPEGSFCALGGGTTYCVAECTPGPVSCRFIEGYACVSFGVGVNGCVAQ